MLAESTTRHVLETSEKAFLTEVRSRASSGMRGVDFGAILTDLTTWSAEPERGLKVREPGDQRTVSFSLDESDVVLWAAYPRGGDGAKVVVLPRIFRRLPEDEQIELLHRLTEIAPKVITAGTGLLQLPLHLLATTQALHGFLALLGVALGFVRKYREATAQRGVEAGVFSTSTALVKSLFSARDIGDLGQRPYSEAHRVNREAFALLWRPLELELQQRNWGASPGAIVERYATPLAPRRVKRLWLSPTQEKFRIRLDSERTAALREMHTRLANTPSMPFGVLEFREKSLLRARGKELCLEAEVPIDRFFSGCRGTNVMATRISEVVLLVLDTADRDQKQLDNNLLADVDLIAAPEGAERLVTHLRRERSPKLRQAKITVVQRETGRLACEACDFDFTDQYGTIGEGFAEVHH